MSLIQWPFKRKQYAGINNPRFVGDIVAANEAVLDAMIAVTGLNPVDFAIISGLTYVPGIPNTYTAGIFYYNGTFYYQPTSFIEGLYLTPNATDIMPQAFEDAVSRKIYNVQYGKTVAVPGATSPQFTGTMDQYRIGTKNLKNAITILQGIAASLGTAAYEDIGTGAGQVMAADDPRFLHIYNNVLTLDNTGVYVPSGDYNPATKKYADEANGLKLMWLGNISSDGLTITHLAGTLTITVAHVGTGHYKITHNFGGLNYFANGFGINQAGGAQSPRGYYNLTNNDFDLVTSDDASLNDSNFQLAIFKYF